MPLAKIHDDSPLEVRLPGSLVGTPVTHKSTGLTGFVVGEDVWVELDQGYVVLTNRLAAP